MERPLRQRGEKLERGFAHMLVTGGLRRVHVRGQEEIRKRVLIHAAAFNLGLLMRKRFGVGTPRGLRGLAAAHAALACRVSTAVLHLLGALSPSYWPSWPDCRPLTLRNPPLAQTQPRLGAALLHAPRGLETHFFHGLLGLLLGSAGIAFPVRGSP